MSEKFKDAIADDGTIWFRDTKTDREHHVERSSVAARLMSKDPAFGRIDGPQGGEIAPDTEVAVVDMGHLSQTDATELILTLLTSFDVSIEKVGGEYVVHESKRLSD